MKILLIISILIFSVNFAFAEDSDWVGVFSHYWEEFNLDGGRTAIWSDLRIKSVKGKLTGIYSEGYNGKTNFSFQVNVKTDSNLAKIYYDNCLPINSCTEGEYKKGDLLFELERKNENEKPVYYTIWRKMFGSGKATRVADKKYIYFLKRT